MKAIIDRIDQGIAVLIVSGESPVRIPVPVSLLPADSAEGDVVTLTIERDAEATREAHIRVKGLIDRLTRN